MTLIWFKERIILIFLFLFFKLLRLLLHRSPLFLLLLLLHFLLHRLLLLLFLLRLIHDNIHLLHFHSLHLFSRTAPPLQPPPRLPLLLPALSALFPPIRRACRSRGGSRACRSAPWRCPCWAGAGRTSKRSTPGGTCGTWRWCSGLERTRFFSYYYYFFFQFKNKRWCKVQQGMDPLNQWVGIFGLKIQY